MIAGQVSKEELTEQLDLEYWFDRSPGPDRARKAEWSLDALKCKHKL